MVLGYGARAAEHCNLGYVQGVILRLHGIPVGAELLEVHGRHLVSVLVFLRPFECVVLERDYEFLPVKGDLLQGQVLFSGLYRVVLHVVGSVVHHKGQVVL